MMYQMLKWYLMSTHPLSYAGYFIQQPLMTYPVIVICNISFFVNNSLEALSWQISFYVTPCILINDIDQLKLCISLCAYI